jgi:tetratricopeptide (TPR) repeat protein
MLISGVARAQQSNRSEGDKLFQDQKWKEAATAYESELKANPKNPGAWFRYGYAVHATGDYKKAAELHVKASEFPQFRPIALYNLACAKALLGDKDGAFIAFDKCVDAGFSDKSQIEGDSDLETLKKDARWEKSFARIDARVKLFRQMDFWVGEWDVLDPKGNKIGTSKIEKGEAGNLILESWSGLAGGTGKSMNFVDPADGKWKQIWIDQAGNVVRYDGEFKDGAMHLTGTNYLSSGLTRKSRMTLTPSSDGKVHQVFEASADEGKTWVTVLDGTYVPKAKPST